MAQNVLLIIIIFLCSYILFKSTFFDKIKSLIWNEDSVSNIEKNEYITKKRFSDLYFAQNDLILDLWRDQLDENNNFSKQIIIDRLDKIDQKLENIEASIAEVKSTSYSVQSLSDTLNRVRSDVSALLQGR